MLFDMPKPHLLFTLIIFYATSLAVPVVGTCPPGSGKPSPPNPLVTCELCGAGKYKIAAGDALCTNCPSNTISPEGSSQELDCVCKPGFLPQTDGSCVMIECPAGKSYTYASVWCSGCSCNEKQENDLNYPNNDGRWPGNIGCGWKVTGNVGIILQQWGGQLQEYNHDWMWTCDKFSDPTMVCGSPYGVDSTWVPSRTHGFSMNWRKRSTCIDCPVATYRSQDDVNTSVICSPCADNSGTDSTASTSVDDCKCNAGWSMLSQPNAVCSKCPSGKYKSERSHDACTRCPMGKFMSGNLSRIPRTVKYTYTKVV